MFSYGDTNTTINTLFYPISMKTKCANDLPLIKNKQRKKPLKPSLSREGFGGFMGGSRFES